MDNRLNNLKQEALGIRLSEEEKAAMRARLREAGASLSAPVASPFVISSYSWLSMRFVVPAALLLVVGLGGTTAYAAQGSLPGSALYPVKIYVNEAVGEALAVSSESKLAYHAAAAQERLKEAEALAAEGRLDASATALIETNFEDHVARADAIARDLDAGDPGAGVEAKVAFESSLSAHEHILARISQDSEDHVTKENSDSLAVRIASRAGADAGGAIAMLKTTATPPAAKVMSLSVSAPENTEAATSADVAAKVSATAATDTPSDASQKKVVLQLQKKADAELASARETFADARIASASTTKEIKAKISEIEILMEEGENYADAGDYDAARESFAAALRASVRLSTLIEASARFDRDFVRSHEASGDAGQSSDEDAESDNQESANSGKQGSQEPGEGSAGDTKSPVPLIHLDLW